MIHRLKEDVRSWYELHRRNGATNVVVWAIYLDLLLMLVLLVLLPFDTVQMGGRYRLIKPLNFTMSMAMYLATVVICWITSGHRCGGRRSSAGESQFAF
jgi:uncharacterized membrane protein